MRFSRTEGCPLVSVFLPTRGRPQGLVEAIDSLHSLCRDKSLVEYVLKADTDDVETVNLIYNLSKVLPIRYIVSPRGKGYLEIHKYLNELTYLCRGDWLLGFNDDAKMLTQDWDQILLEVDASKVPGWAGTDEICLIGTQIVERDISWEMPIIRRKAIEVLGHFTFNFSADSWIYWVMSGINAAFLIEEIKVSHYGNEIDDTTKREGRGVVEKMLDTLNTDEMKRLRELDKKRLLTYMGK